MIGNELLSRLRIRTVALTRGVLAAFLTCVFFALFVNFVTETNLRATQRAIVAPSPAFELTKVFAANLGYVNALSLSPDGRWLAIACDDGKVKLWRVESGDELRVLAGHTGAVYALTFSPDSRRLATGSLDETIRLWEIRSGQEIQTFRGHSEWVNALAFSPDGTRIVSAGRDGTVRIWDVQSGSSLRVISDYPSEVFTVALSPDGRLIASDKGDSFCLRAAARGKEIAGGIAAQWGINTLAFSPDGKNLFSAGYDSRIWIWGITASAVAREMGLDGGPIISISLTGDGSLLAALCIGDKTVKILDTRTWKEAAQLEGVSYPAGSVSFSRDGRWLAAGGGDSPVRVWRRRE